MDLSALIAAYRRDADDRVAGYLSSRTDLIEWFNEAEEEACLRKRLIRVADDADLCIIDVTAPTSIYALHPKLAWVTRADFTPDGDADPINLRLCSVGDADRLRPDWRTTTMAPECLIVEDAQVQLACIPETSGELKLEGYRLPLDRIEDRASESPEIHAAHHRHLVKWVLHRAHSRPDSQIYDPERAQRSLEEFEAHFGPRVDGDRRRDTENDMPQVNVSFP